MPRLLLPHDCSAADRARGCVWASTFRSRPDEVDKLGVFSGTPAVNRGVTLNGTGDYLRYSMWGQFAAATNWSASMEMWPSFAADDGLNHYFFSTSGEDYTLFKRSTNGLLINIGNAAITTIALASYGPYWVTNGRNILTINSTSGSTNAWLNGAQILTAAAAAWAPVNVTDLYVGIDAALTAGRYFAGTIKHLRFYNTLLTAGDHAAIWAGGGA